MEIEVMKKAPRDQWGEERVYVLCSVWMGIVLAFVYLHFDARPGLELIPVLLFTNWYINNYTLPTFREYELSLPFLEQDVPDDVACDDGDSAVGEGVGAEILSRYMHTK